MKVRTDVWVWEQARVSVSVCAGRCENVRGCARVFQVGTCQESFFEVGECALCMFACELHVNYNDICKPTSTQYYTHTQTHTHTYTHTHTHNLAEECAALISRFISASRAMSAASC